jgi:hypothetical protein
MDVIRGTNGPRRRRRWWAARPALRLVRGPQAPQITQTPQTREDPFAIAMIGSFGIFVLAFAIFMGAWTGSSTR